MATSGKNITKRVHLFTKLQYSPPQMANEMYGFQIKALP